MFGLGCFRELINCLTQATSQYDCFGFCLCLAFEDLDSLTKLWHIPTNNKKYYSTHVLIPSPISRSCLVRSLQTEHVCAMKVFEGFLKCFVSE